MENKTTHKQKPAYGMASNCAFMIRRAWRECKGVLSVCAGLVFCGVAASLLELFVVPAILKAVEGGAAPGALVRLILWFTLGMVLVRAFRAYLDENTLFGRVTVRSSLCLDLHMHFCRTSFPHTEDPDYIKRVRKASRCLDSNRDSGEAVWKTMTDLTTNVISFLIYLLLLAQAGPWVAGLCMVLAAAGYFAGEHIRSWRYRHREEEGRLNSHLDYMIARSRDIQLAKDIRIFGIGPWLTELYDKYGRLCQDFYAKSYRCCLWADLLDLGLALARNGAAYGLLIAMALRGELTAAEFVLYFTAVSGFAQWVTGIFAQLGTLHRQSLELSTLREVMETEEPFRFEGGKPLAVKENHLYQLELRDVSFRYQTEGAGEDVLKHINLTVEPGEFVAIVGGTGTGKSSLVNLIPRFYDVHSGKVLVDGVEVKGTGVDRGVVFQQYALFPWLTVKKNVEFGLKLKKDVTPQQREETAMKYIKMVGLEKFVDSYPKELSGGMKQRVAIARAYAVNPSLLLMDEPFGALDAQTRTQLQTELLRTWEEEKKTCFFITHDVEEAILLASKVIIMSARPGRIREVLDIDIPYPRTQETKILPRFTELKNYIWNIVYREYLEVQQ